jgi:hypothetical protein
MSLLKPHHHHAAGLLVALLFVAFGVFAVANGSWSGGISFLFWGLAGGAFLLADFRRASFADALREKRREAAPDDLGPDERAIGLSAGMGPAEAKALRRAYAKANHPDTYSQAESKRAATTRMAEVMPVFDAYIRRKGG